MMKIPYEQLIKTISEKTGVSEADLGTKIDAKLKQLSGLISKEGAAHIIANELGVSLFDQAQPGKVKIKDISPGMRNVELLGKVTAVYEVREFQRENRSGKVGSFMIGDETGITRVVCWGSQADKIQNLSTENTVKLKSGYVKENNNFKEVHMNDMSAIVIDPPGETVSEVKGNTSSKKKISELTEEDTSVEIMGHIVSAFDPNFFEVCPECGKRAKREGDGFSCPVHGIVTPNYSYVMNVVIDDGTENMRAVFFRDQLGQLLKKSPEEMEEFRKRPDTFVNVKNGLLGDMIKLQARVTKNQMFDRLELIAQRVEMPDPKAELEKINQ